MRVFYIHYLIRSERPQQFPQGTEHPKKIKRAAKR
jgi:hypothetical protein